MIKVTFEVEMLVDPEATTNLWKECGWRQYLLDADYNLAINEQIKELAGLINEASSRIQVDSLQASNIKIRDSRIDELLAQQKELEAML